MRKNEGGYIVVETISSFLLFVLLNISILSLINIVAVQARVHYALTQAAETVSMYCYVLDVTDAADHLMASAGQAAQAEARINEFKENVTELLNAVNKLSVSDATDAAGNLYDQVDALAGEISSDPKAVLQEFLNLALTGAVNRVFESTVDPLIRRYLNNGEDITGRQYLDSAGAGDLDFEGSVFLTNNGEVKIVVQYDIDYTFGALPIPFGQLHITQEVITKAWLNGKGTGYQK